MPYVVGAGLAGWMVAYGRRAKRRGEQLAAAEAAAAAAGPDTPEDRHELAAAAPAKRPAGIVG
jgi:hypothetical protein